MFCHKCGKEIKDHVQFCPWCGAELSPSNADAQKLSHSSVRHSEAEVKSTRGGIKIPVLLAAGVVLVVGLSACTTILNQGGPSSAAVSVPESSSTQAVAESVSAQTPASISEQTSSGTSASGVPAESAADSPLTGMESLSSAPGYGVHSSASTTQMFESPDAASQTLADLYRDKYDVFYLLKKENDWGYGVFMGQAGWCKMSDLEPDPDGISRPLPDFLSPELQCKYLQALTLYDNTRWGSNRRDFSTEIMIDGAPFCKTSMFGGQYQTYENLVNTLFTGSYRDAAFFSGHFKNQGGELYETSGDGGAILSVDLQDYSFRLEQQTEEEISFTLVGNYYGYGNNTPSAQAYTKEWPIVMVKESDGQWRFTQFASALNGNLSFE